MPRHPRWFMENRSGYPDNSCKNLKRRQKDDHDFLYRLRTTMERLRPTWKRHGQRSTFIFKDMNTTPQVFVRHDAPSGTLHPPYDGPYEVLGRGEKTFKLRVKGKAVHVSIDRLKPAYVINDNEASQAKTDTEKTTQRTTKSGRTSRQPVRFAPS